jgi:hypothetical protein
MSVSSLTKMTTPLASDQSATSQGLLMPKLSYRFRVVFENLGVSTPRTELTKQVKDFKRPNPSFEQVVVDVYNSKIKLAGKPSWADVTCNIRDDVSGSVSRLLGEQMQKQYDFMEQASAASGIDYKFTTRLEMLDGGNGVHEATVLETWEMYGCYLTGVDYGTVDYSSSEPVMLGITMSMDNAVQTSGTVGIGTDIGRTIGQNVTG